MGFSFRVFFLDILIFLVVVVLPMPLEEEFTATSSITTMCYCSGGGTGVFRILFSICKIIQIDTINILNQASAK